MDPQDQQPKNQTTGNPQLDQYIGQVEKDLLDHIVGQLKEKKITVEESQQLAREFLAVLPPQDKEDLLKKLYKLAKKHPAEVLDVYVKYEGVEFEKEREQNLQELAELIHAGNIEGALARAKEVNKNG